MAAGTAAPAEGGDEFISAEEVVVSPRGRKLEIDANLAATLKKLKSGQAVRLSSSIGAVSKEQRATVSASIRKHWKHVRADGLRIDYSADGVPQVRVRDAK
jgi:hypothetical protein